jgi:hypothetical protein
MLFTLLTDRLKPAPVVVHDNERYWKSLIIQNLRLLSSFIFLKMA